MKVIAFSLWGDEPRYMVGALRNAELAHSFYRGWICRFYAGSSVPAEVVRALESMDNTDVRRLEEPGDWRALFWRFLPGAESDVEVFLSRDVDSRLSGRESEAVHEWLRSDRGIHIMRDHPWHNVPMLGGMWGARRGRVPGLLERISAWPAEDRWQSDQEFLREEVFPRIRHDSLIHDEFFGGIPFPSRRAGGEFVGQQFDQHGQVDAETHHVLIETLSKQRLPLLRRRLLRSGFRLGIWPVPESLRRLASVGRQTT